MDDSPNKGLSATDTELTVRVNTEIIHSALILWHTLPLDGCVFSCEKSLIMSARAPPCRIWISKKIKIQITRRNKNELE